MSSVRSPFYSSYLKADTANPPAQDLNNSKNPADGDAAKTADKTSEAEKKKKSDLKPPSYPPNMPGKSGDGQYESFLPIFPSAAMVAGNTVFNNNPIDLLQLNFGNDLEGWKEAGIKGSLLNLASFLFPPKGMGEMAGDSFEEMRKQKNKRLNFLA